MKRFNTFIVSILFISAFTACVTTKKKGKVSWAQRQFNNVTTHYNYHFNANVLYEEALAKLNEQHQDNYNKILDLYPAFAVENAKSSVGQEMDKAIKKVSTASVIHSKGDWVDDCYLLMGQCQFLKQDYEIAEETFVYMVDEMTPAKVDKRSKTKKKKSAVKEKEKAKEKKVKDKKEAREDVAKDKKKALEEKKKASEKKKKEIAKAKAEAAKAKKRGEKVEPKKLDFEEGVKPTKEALKEEIKQEKEEEKEGELEPSIGEKDEKPKKHILKHRPSHQEAQLWLAKTYIQRKKFDEATDLLLGLLKRKSTFPDVRREAAKTYAFYFLNQKEYEKAILPLTKAIELSKSKLDKARMTYILGQIHQEAGRNQDALMAFEKVSKSKAPYEMEFNARMNVALFAYYSGKASIDDAISTLTKMSKDSKNEDYKDQIYYTLAQIGLKNNDRKMALQNLQLSLDNSTKNQTQKAESYLQLARLYLEDENYIKAKCYYDSSLTVINKSDERYDEVKRYAFGLTDIAKSIETITLQDSLIKLGALSKDEKMALAKKMKKAQDDAAAKAAAALVAKDAPKTNSSDFVGSSVPSTFFAYSSKSIQSGKKSFNKKWNNRKLEDNWRRSQKTTGADVVTDDKAAVKVSNENTEFTEADMNRMLQGVPSSGEQVNAMKDIVNDAMLKLGKAYREQLIANGKCVKTLEELNIRFPEGKNELESWYYLYLAHIDLKQQAKAKEYYDKITAKYPNTTYARILVDPNFVGADEKEKRALGQYYKSTYEAFSKGQYKVAYDNSSKADSVFGQKNTFKAKFALLNAMSAGNIFGKDKYIALIKEVIAKFPETAEQKRAKEILRMLESNGLSTVSNSGNNSDENAENSIFKVEDESIHYAVIAIKDKKARIEEVKSKVGEFTREYFRLDNLKITNVFFGEESEIPLIVIRKFADKTKAMEFCNEVKRREGEFVAEGTAYDFFVITQNNYKELLKSKSVEPYKTFFGKNYGQN